MVFPSNTHPGRVVEGGGRERDGWNGVDKSSAPAIREGGGGGLSLVAGEACHGRSERREELSELGLTKKDGALAGYLKGEKAVVQIGLEEEDEERNTAPTGGGEEIGAGSVS
uniref:DUF834 domain-containing protein n=1 Tax=Oryza barthii TaxID=65489 RepID=A0A0D3EU90_9ORYZ